MRHRTGRVEGWNTNYCISLWEHTLWKIWNAIEHRLILLRNRKCIYRDTVRPSCLSVCRYVWSFCCSQIILWIHHDIMVVWVWWCYSYLCNLWGVPDIPQMERGKMCSWVLIHRDSLVPSHMRICKYISLFYPVLYFRVWLEPSL